MRRARRSDQWQIAICGLAALALCTVSASAVEAAADPAPVRVFIDVVRDGQPVTLNLTGTKPIDSPWPANTDSQISWPILNWGSACPNANASEPTVSYSAALLKAPSSAYVAVVHKLIDFPGSCFANHKIGYVSSVPTPPAAILFWGEIDAESGQVTSRFGLGVLEFFYAIPVVYVGAGQTILPTLFALNSTVSPTLRFERGPVPQITWNTRAIEPSSIVGPLLLGVLMILCGLLNYFIFRYKRMRRQPMVSSGPRSIWSLWYKPPAEPTDEEIDAVFPKSDDVAETDCPICLGRLSEAPPEKVDLDTAKGAILRAAGVDATEPMDQDSPPNRDEQSVQQATPAEASAAPDAVSNSETALPAKPLQLRKFAGCSHLFHASCAESWVRTKSKQTRFGTMEIQWTCPVCRADHPAWIEAHGGRQSGDVIELREVRTEQTTTQ